MRSLRSLLTASCALALAVLPACSGSSTDTVPSAAGSSFSADPPDPVADGAATTQLTLRLANSGGGAIPFAAVTVELAGAGNSVTQDTPITDQNGRVTLTVTSMRAEPKDATVTVQKDGRTTQFTIPAVVTFTAGLPDASRSTATISPSTVLADGSAAATIELDIRDSFDNPCAGATVQLAPDGYENVLEPAAPVVGADGRATSTWTSSRAETKRLTVSVDFRGASTPIVPSPEVTFVPVAGLDESEPNDDAGSAARLGLGTAGYGEVGAAGDVDFWRVDLQAGDVVDVRIFGARYDHGTWQANANVPRLTVWTADGSQKLVEQDYSGTFSSQGWSWDAADLDILRFRADATASYAVSVTQDDTTRGGGAYALVVEVTPVGATQGEGSTITGSTVLRGVHQDDERDDYPVQVQGPTVMFVRTYGYRGGVRHDTTATPDYFDPEIFLTHDLSGNVVSNDDHAFYDSGLGVLLAEAGDYTLGIDEAGGTGETPYFVDVELVPVSTTSEVEPNGSTAEANPLPFDQFVAGECSALADADYFAVDATAGDVLTVELFDVSTTLPAPPSAARITVEILDPSGALKSFTESPGWRGYSTLVTTTGTHHVRLTPWSDLRSPYVVRVTHTWTGAESEPNDDVSTADTLTAFLPLCGTIESASDADVFAVTADRTDQLLAFALICQMPNASQLPGVEELGSVLSGRLVLRDQNGGVMVESRPIGDPYPISVGHGEAGAELAVRVPTAGTYYLEVVDDSGSGSPGHYYVVRRTH